MQLSLFSSIGVVWLIVPILVAAIGLLAVFRGFRHVAGGKPGRASANLAAGTPLALLGVVFTLLGFNAQSFERLTYESTVAEVHVRLVDRAQSLYDVTIVRKDADTPPQTCRIQGDAWEMSARVQKWKPWANVLGLDATYQLDQISNRYTDAARANGRMITSCDLKGPLPAVDTYVPQSVLFWITSQAYVEDRHFGSAAYMPLADGASFRVIMTQSGLNAEPINDRGRAANGN